jgi:hypothetical protein
LVHGAFSMQEEAVSVGLKASSAIKSRYTSRGMLGSERHTHPVSPRGSLDREEVCNRHKDLSTGAVLSCIDSERDPRNSKGVLGAADRT